MINGFVQGGIKQVIRGTAAAAGSIDISSMNLQKTRVRSWSNGSSGYVAARGTISSASYGTDSGSGFGNHSITGGETDLTVKVYHAYIDEAGQRLYYTGPCRYELEEEY